MMFSSIKGGEKAIDASHKLIAKRRRGDPSIRELSVAQIREQLSLAVDRVMSEGSLYDPTVAALAIKQAEGDLMEAIFLVRAFRTTLPRFGYTEAIDTTAMTVRRRISTTHKDVPGGQLLGPTYDYTHRLLDFSLLSEAEQDMEDRPAEGTIDDVPMPAESLVPPASALTESDLFEPELHAKSPTVADVTREPILFPTGRDTRLQSLSRGEEGFLLGLAYSTLRGFGSNHPFIAEMRHGDVSVEMDIPEIGLKVGIGTMRLTECQTIHMTTRRPNKPPHYTRGYGLVLGHGERKALSMAIVERALRASEFGEDPRHPAQLEEFVLYHSDSVEAAGLVQHLKLPHYVDFQGQLQFLRQAKAEYESRQDPSAKHSASREDINA